MKTVTVRAHLQPVLPADAHPPVTASRVTLLINGLDCGSRLVSVEDASSRASRSGSLTQTACGSWPGAATRSQSASPSSSTPTPPRPQHLQLRRKPQPPQPEAH